MVYYNNAPRLLNLSKIRINRADLFLHGLGQIKTSQQRRGEDISGNPWEHPCKMHTESERRSLLIPFPPSHQHPFSSGLTYFDDLGTSPSLPRVRCPLSNQRERARCAAVVASCDGWIYGWILGLCLPSALDRHFRQKNERRLAVRMTGSERHLSINRTKLLCSLA